MVNFPINLKLGSIEIPSHLILYLLAFYLGIHYYTYLRHEKGDFMNSDNRWYLIIGAAIGAFLFSRLLSSLENPALFFNPPNLLYYFSAQTIVGGLIGGIIGVEITKKIINEKRSTGDLFVKPLILGIIIGRIGCFLTGVSDRTVGVASNLPWAIDQGDGILRHPTSLYEILFLVIFWIFLEHIQKKVKLKNGVLFRLFITSYLIFRFIIEFIKPINPLYLGLSAIQIASLIGVLYYIKTLYSKGIIQNGKEK